MDVHDPSLPVIAVDVSNPLSKPVMRGFGIGCTMLQHFLETALGKVRPAIDQRA